MAAVGRRLRGTKMIARMRTVKSKRKTTTSHHDASKEIVITACPPHAPCAGNGEPSVVGAAAATVRAVGRPPLDLSRQAFLQHQCEALLDASDRGLGLRAHA